MPKPKAPQTDFADGGKAVHQNGHWVWLPLRSAWVDSTHRPEELVRQEWIRRLVVDGGFNLQQMDQERRTLTHGTGSPRADIVIWESAQAKAAGASAILVVETKATAGAVILSDFRQGESYARAGGCQFMVAATAGGHSVYQLTPGFPGRAIQINEWPTAADFEEPRRLAKLKDSLRVFDRDEFQKLLFECHSLLRDHHAMTPDRAFDTISKVLFIKLYIERQGTHGTFTTNFLHQREATRLPEDKPVHDQLFDLTQTAFKADDLFEESDKLDISEATFAALVEKLQRFNLSKTDEDIKGIAFERFLGRTFRGELGQFFTPRPVVDFMVEALDPQEGQLVCDPAAGSGGFLIKVFDHVKDAISADIEKQKNEQFNQISSQYGPDSTETQLAERDHRIDEAFASLNADLVPTQANGSPSDTRVGRLAWHCIFGTDKEPRAARTAKMNMIMHGDGHGGIHWHDGLVDINGIFEGRFDYVVTNPPFGASVTKTQLVGATTESDVPDDPTYARRQRDRYGSEWRTSHKAVVAARGTPILNLYEIGRGKNGRQTETLFVERCLRLLKRGGMLAIVLPSGNLNAASLAWLRRWAEGKAFLRAVIALPIETFKFSKASVSASVVILQRFTEQDEERWEGCWAAAEATTRPLSDEQRDALVNQHERAIITAKEDSELVGYLSALTAHDIERVLPDYESMPTEGFERGAGVTRIGTPVWQELNVPPSAEAISLKRAYATRSRALSRPISEQLSLLRASLREVDRQQTAAMWTEVRSKFDYPVFMATPATVGITASGETGPQIPNDLPEILQAWRQFRRWLDDGMPEGGPL